jgi:hypothetical protein
LVLGMQKACLPDVCEVGREIDGHGTAVEFDCLE